MTGDDRLRELEEKYEGYRIYDNSGEKIGKVDDLFVDEEDREEYIGVKMGFFGMRSTLIPMDVARVNERDRVIEVSESKQRVKDAPSFEDDEDITPDFEERIRLHFGLSGHEGSSSRGSYGGRSSGTETRAEEGAGTTAGTTASSTRDEGLDRDAEEDRELDVEGAPAGTTAGTSGHREGSREGSHEGAHEESHEREGREEYRNREDHTGGSGTTDTAASGAPSDLETGDRGEDRGSSQTPDPYREGYEEGLREAGREAARREAQARGEGDSESRESGSTESASGRETASHSDGGHDDHERRHEGETSESTSTKVWRRIRS